MIAASDLPALRSLIRARIAAGWTIAGPYGERGYRQHVYREPTEPAWSGAKVCVEGRTVEYHPATVPGLWREKPQSIRPGTAEDLASWLRLLGLLPTIAASDPPQSPVEQAEPACKINSRVGAIA